MSPSEAAAGGGHAVVVGARGVIGRALIERFDADPAWRVTGVSRRPPERLGGAAHVAVDLHDRAAAEAALGALDDATHLYFAAYEAMESRAAEVAPNLELLRNAVEPIAAAAGPRLRHVNLMEGGKWYGCHLGPFPTPAREDDPRHLPPNFYYDQQDWLEAASAASRAGAGGEEAGWTWSALRPEAVSGFSLGTPMNLVMAIAVYAAICRELDVPFAFPGKPGAYAAMYEVTDARLLAHAAEWAATTPSCAGEAFNLTNGDTFRWCNLWPRFAARFGLRHAPPRTLSLREFMADKGPVWERVVARAGLVPHAWEEVAAWGFADAVFASDWDIVRSTLKARAHGFHAFVETETMFLGLFDELERARVIPAP
jgi:nucleoside-diphosphate-sugar epimerase